MDVKQFFHNKGFVICTDHSETIKVIVLCKKAGLPIYSYHDYAGIHIHPFWNKRKEFIDFAAGVLDDDYNCVSFNEFMDKCCYEENVYREVGDLL